MVHEWCVSFGVEAFHFGLDTLEISILQFRNLDVMI